MKFKGYSFLLTLLAMLVISNAQAENLPQPVNDFFRQSGKIYVVVAILSVIFIGILVYLIGIDRRVRKIEKQKGTGKR